MSNYFNVSVDENSSSWTFVETAKNKFTCHEVSDKFSVELVVEKDGNSWIGDVSCGDMEIPEKTLTPYLSFKIPLPYLYTTKTDAAKNLVLMFNRILKAFMAFDNPSYSDFNKCDI